LCNGGGDLLALERKQKIYNLMIKQKTIQTAQNYASILGVSKRTIYSDLNEIKDELFRNGYELISIAGKGFEVKQISLKAFSHEEIEVHLKTMPDVRKIEIMKTLLFKNESVTLNSLSEKYYVSVSSIKNDLNKLIELYTNKYTAKIVSDPQGIQIIGNEESIQALFVKFNEECFKEAHQTPINKEIIILKKYYGDTIVQTSLESICEFDKSNLVFIANYYKLNILNVLTVLLYRASKGKNINYIKDALYIDEIMNLPNMLLSKQILAIASKKLNISFSKYDYWFFSNQLKANRIETGSNQNIKQENLDVINRIITRMSDCLNINIFEHKNMLNSLVMHLDSMIYRLKNNIFVRNYLIDQIKQEFRVMFELTWLILDSECSTLDVNLTEDEVGFVLIHFQNVVDIEQKSKKVLVICPTGNVSAQMVTNRLKKILPPLDIVEIASLEKSKKSILNSFDFIISTVEININNLNIPILYVSPLIGEEDIKNIGAFYNSTFLLDKEIEKNDFSHLSKYIDPQLIFVNDKEITRDELIEKVMSTLYEKDYVLEGYHQSILEREKLGGTDTNFSAATPHGEIKYVKKTVIAIWVNKTPIKWTNYSVKLVIFLNIAQEDLKECKLILENVYWLIKLKSFNKLISQEITKENIMFFIGMEE